MSKEQNGDSQDLETTQRLGRTPVTPDQAGREAYERFPDNSNTNGGDKK